MFLWILWFLLKWFWSKFADIYIGWPALIVYSLSFVVFIPGSSLWIRESLHIKWSAVLCFVGQKLVYSVSMATFSPNQIVQLACISRHLRIVIVQYYFSMRLFWIDQLWVINQYHTNSPIWHASLANVIWLFLKQIITGLCRSDNKCSVYPLRMFIFCFFVIGLVIGPLLRFYKMFQRRINIHLGKK